jgi:2-C-methyl-D-erythritol 4-phosphate cytidylyltransferase
LGPAVAFFPSLFTFFMNVAIIAAAGRGSRMAGTRPKQFLELAGIPIIFHTLKSFEQCDSIQKIICVLPAEESAGFPSLAERAGLHKVAEVVPGGETRAQSVARGLAAVQAGAVEIVAVHDGVRPFVTPEEIARVVDAAKTSGAAILVAPVTDTIKEVSGSRVTQTLDRSRLRSALTPQCFRFDLLWEAYRRVDLNDPSLTDDSLVVEQTGAQVIAIEGSKRNIKITTQEDLALAATFLRV